MSELTPNVEVRKQKKPKNWSYPVQTTELVEGLDLGSCGCPVRIFYSNCPIVRWLVMSITWQQGLQPEPYFTLSVYVVPGTERKFWNGMIVQEVLPVLKEWLHVRHPLNDSATLYFYDYSWCDFLRAAVEVNHKVTLWERKWDREYKGGRRGEMPGATRS